MLNKMNETKDETKDETKLSAEYQMKDPRNHILDAPDTYIGGIDPDRVEEWTYHEDKIKKKYIEFIPGLFKCFDECIVNCRDHFIRQMQKKNEGEDVNTVSLIDIEIDKKTGIITLLNDGDGVDVAIHPVHNIYIPEMIFANLMSSSNYDKNKDKITGGKNGFGIKLVFIYSTWGKVETVDHRRGLKYVQEFKNNLSEICKPKITKTKTKTPYTKVYFKLDFDRFGIKTITDDIFNIFKKRAYDISSVTDRTVKVKFNKTPVPVKTFKDYINMYIESSSKKIYEKKPRWEYCVCNTPFGEYTQISFVNGVFTSKGGRHVDYLTTQLVKKISAYILKKKKIKVSPSSIKEQLMLFLNVAITNPAFDSQTKNYLTTPSSKFGSKCEISDKFVEDVVKKLGIMDAAINLTQLKENKKSSTITDGSQRKTIHGIPKLTDANKAGTSMSKKCTLILCEGDSAKAGVISGLTKEDRDYYGCFPLKGKLVNVSDLQASKINQNAEIANIKKIVGLKSGFKYNTIDDINNNLRYGRIMFMTDQDLDGSHIKGLCINLFHCEWPELTKVESFLSYMNTPIIKAKKGAREKNFYTEQDYHVWKNSEDIKGWVIKYFKGLGTSTAREFKQYFNDMKTISFNHHGEQCVDAIDLAFNKKRADDRKDWLRNYDKDDIMNIKSGGVSFQDWTNKELSHFSKYDCDRSIPNLVDGNKISTRKILYGAFKRNLCKEIKVAQLVGYISEKSGYHHGEKSLVGAITGMAAEYVGNNNISLFVPSGQFGTRLAGGTDHASERYIFTYLNPITKAIYREEDNAILNYLDDDGFLVEPDYYIPIVPMVCVNGGKGIGTGFSTDIPCFNLMQIITYLESKINKDNGVNPIVEPYYEDFKGDIIKITDHKYLIKGKYEITGVDVIRITELPIGTWTNTYKEFLESLMDSKDKKNKKSPIIKSYKDMCTDTLVDFEIKFISGTINKLLSTTIDDNINGLEKTLKLFTTKSLTNMWLFDNEQKLEKYENIYNIIDKYYPIRYNAYITRKEYLIKLLEKEVCILKNKARFILEQCNDTFDLRRKKKEYVIKLLNDRNYDIVDEDGEYKYLRKMTIEQVEEENMNKLLHERDIKIKELESLKNKTPETMWLNELNELKIKYTNYRKERKLRKSNNISIKSKKSNKSKSGTKSTMSTKSTKSIKNKVSYNGDEEKN